MKKIYLFLSLALLSLAGNAQYTRTLHWVGGNTTWVTSGSNRWYYAANWIDDATGQVPTTNVTNGDKCVIDSNNITVNDLTINYNNFRIELRGTASFTISSGKTLTLGSSMASFAITAGSPQLILAKASGNRTSDRTNLKINGYLKAQNIDRNNSASLGTGSNDFIASGSTTPVQTGNSSGFGGFATMGAGALPVVLVDFNALLKGSQVALSWTTREEINFSHFSIERSTDGVNWTVIGSVTATGNGAPITRYAFADGNPASGINYYRMKMVDLDGKYGISPIKAVRVSSSEVKMSVYPNPAVGQVNILVNQSGSDAYTVNVYNRNGQLVLSRKADGRSNVLNLDVSHLPAGTYLVDLQLADGSRQSRQLMVASH